jgi:Domain of unknown function (DUF4249)
MSYNIHHSSFIIHHFLYSHTMKFCIHIFYTTIILFFLINLNGCIEEIPFKTDTGDGLLVVDGGFSDADEPQTIVLQKTSAFGTVPQSILGASVVVKSLDGQSGKYSEKGDGKYVLDTKILRGSVGKSYYLEIALPNGQTYQSEPEVMPARVVPDSVFWDSGTENIVRSNQSVLNLDVVNIYVSTPLKVENKDTYLRWDLQSAFQFTTLPECTPFRTTTTCYYSDIVNPQTFQVVSSQETGLSRTNKTRVAFQTIDPAYPFLERHYFSLYQHAISAKAYDYWQKTNVIANQNGSIFDKAPASIKGNFFNKNNKNEQVLGYFQVSSVAIKRTFIRAVEVKVFYPLLPKEEYCPLLRRGNRFSYSDGCCDCLTLPYGNATKAKPSWW